MEEILIRELAIKDIEAISAIYSGIIQKPVKPDFKELIQTACGTQRKTCALLPRSMGRSLASWSATF